MALPSQVLFISRTPQHPWTTCFSVTTVMIRNSFLISDQNFPCCKLCPLTFTSWKRLWLHLLCNPPLGTWRKQLHPPLVFFPPSWTLFSQSHHAGEANLDTLSHPWPLTEGLLRWSSRWDERKHIFIHLNLHFQPQLLITADFQEVWS